jgi:hypothetical protein
MGMWGYLHRVPAERLTEMLAEPLDCGALLRWIALAQVARLRHCADWVRVATWHDRAGDARRPAGDPAHLVGGAGRSTSGDRSLVAAPDP